MKIFILATLTALTAAFAPQTVKATKTSSELGMDRRQFCATATLGFLGGLPAIAKPASTWFWDEKIENVYEPAQQATDGRLDLNNAFVVSEIFLKYDAPRSAGRNRQKTHLSHLSFVFLLSITG